MDDLIEQVICYSGNGEPNFEPACVVMSLNKHRSPAGPYFMHKAQLNILNSALHLWLLSPAPCRLASSIHLTGQARRHVASASYSRAPHFGSPVPKEAVRVDLKTHKLFSDPKVADLPPSREHLPPSQALALLPRERVPSPSQDGHHPKRKSKGHTETRNGKFTAAIVGPVPKRPPKKPYGPKRSAGRQQKILPRNSSTPNISLATNDQDVEQAWAVYRSNITQDLPALASAEIHRLFHILATQKPQVRKNASRMRQLVDELRLRKATSVREWEWNSLILASASGFRSIPAKDYHSALAVLSDWEEDLAQVRSHLKTSQKAGVRLFDFAPSAATYNILLSIAMRTRDQDLVQDALTRLRSFSSGRSIPFDRYTRLTLLARHRTTGRMDRILVSLKRMLNRKETISTDEANATIWSMVWNNHIEEAAVLYSKMTNRHRYLASPLSDRESPNNSLNSTQVSSYSGLMLCRFPEVVKAFEGLEPDEKTFTILIQAYAYKGQLVRALAVLQDYLDFVAVSSGTWTRAPPREPPEVHLLAVFRALIIGFVKYGYYRQILESKRSEKALVKTPRNLTSNTFPVLGARIDYGSSRPYPEQSTHNPTALLHIIRSYVVLSSALSSAYCATTPLTLPPVSFVRTIMLAIRNTAGDDTGFRCTVWSLLVRERLAPCGQEWRLQRASKPWRKMREEFGINWSWDKQAD